MPRARQLPLPFAVPSERPDALPTFFASASNQTALAWLGAPQTWPDGRLLLWGAEGSGKTHLLRSWALGHDGVRVDGPTLRWPPPASCMAVDDADLAPEEALLHLLNDAAAAGLPMLLAARSPAASWTTALPDLASRLRATTAVPIEPADDALLGAILRRLCADRQLAAPEAVQAFLLAHLPRTASALQEAVARLDRAALARGGKATRALAASVVDEMAAMWHAETS